MARFDKNIDIGLTTIEATLIATPLRELTPEKTRSAFLAMDKRLSLVRDLNAVFVPEKFDIQIMKKDSLEPFQSPCNTDVIITNEAPETFQFLICFVITAILFF